MDIEGRIADTLTKIYEKKLLDIVKNGKMPEHVAVIMDGNRRYAMDLGLDPIQGHYMGKEKLYEFLNWCIELKIKVVTVYAFSTENFKRSSREVEALMKLFEESIDREMKEGRIHREMVKVRIIGRRDLLPENLKKKVEEIEEATKNYNRYILNLAIGYGGREEILKAIRDISREVLEGRITPEKIDEEVVRKHLYTGDIPDPDLILRTSGEERISNFLLWQMAYSELYFADVYWPSFSKIDFLRAILSYQRRSRRYGT
ncbi:MAG: di-trans,poly-cis-decaprenylcistransferase [Thermoplasmata archaeon]|jgi:tritrans,polycis-undecaprenyl-diphosphate synthase [geranylgeranyl-diphosphate specific]|nr:di-trans,poly-cis-decaprenylcistransferase [Thermoplasmata archaeon]MVT13212.1 di-trans,poly-cis-decaprenylcistransferase [Euryarchaeota archaeon]